METCRPRLAQVTALRFSRNGALLASGSKDTDIVVWDVAGEAGLYRLRGHRDQVRCAALASSVATYVCGHGCAAGRGRGAVA